MSEANERTAAARPRWLVPVAAAVALVVVVVIAVVALGGDDEPSDEAGGTTEPVQPSAVELELVDLDLADAAAPTEALEGGDLTVAMVPGTVRAAGDLVALDDDRDALASEPIVPVVHLDVALPELDSMLQPVSSALTTDALAGLVAETGAGGRSEDVVQAWLETEDLASPTPIDAPGSMRIQVVDAPDLALAAMVYGEVLLAAGFEVEYLSAVPATADLVTAIGDRGADMVLAGGSSLLLALGGSADDLPPADELGSAVGEQASTITATALTPATADRELVALTSSATAEDLDLATLSDLGTVTGRRQVGAPAGCDGDPLCRARLEEGYGLRFAS